MKTPDADFVSTPHDAITDRAADYVQRRRLWVWSDADQAELDSWLAASTSHRVAYLRLEGAVAYADELAALDSGRSAGNALGVYDKFVKLRFVLPVLAAALVALAAFGGHIAAYFLQPPDRTYSTDVGGRTLLSFSDNTQIELNTNTAVRYRMTTAERTVWLEKGEAWFHVSHDNAHPFSVIVGKHRVTDLGTEFVVRRKTNDMEVALLNGRATLSTEGAQTATLIPGDDAVATSVSMSLIRKTSQELADELAWRQGMLVFRNIRLADAVREVNRYNTTKLVIADPSIADLRFNGEIKNNNFEGFLHIAQTMMKLRADRQGQQILLSRDAPEKAGRIVRTKSAP